MNDTQLSEFKYKQATNIYQDMLRITQEVKSYLLNDYLKSEFIADFDRYRAKLINTQFSIIIDLLNLLFKLICKFRTSASNENFKFYIDLIICNSISKIRNYVKEPFNYFPDINLWLVKSVGRNSTTIGVCNLRTRDVLWSTDSKKRGSISSRMVYTDVKSILKTDFEDPERENIARVRLFAWLRCAAECDVSSSARTLEDDDLLPKGFQISHSFLNDYQLPTKLFYTGIIGHSGS